MPHSCADATCSTEQYWKGEEVSWNKEKGVNLATCVADSSWRILSRQKQSSSSDTHSMKSKPWMFTTLRSGGRGNCNKYCLQSRGWWCGTDRARVTSRLFSGPCKQSRPMTCSIMPFEEEASSVTTKKNQGVPLLTIGSSSWLQRGFCHAAHPKKLLDEVKAEKHRGEPGLWFVWCLPAFQFCSGSIDRSYHLTTYRAREANFRSMLIPSVEEWEFIICTSSCGKRRVNQHRPSWTWQVWPAGQGSEPNIVFIWTWHAQKSSSMCCTDFFYNTFFSSL
ncbi:uncharacterized protein LOC118247810 isoform X1 [Cygnus atratus]|uniref:uncharacterized protein LOC118247810 isoform X1 n=1 Tax=Cygnus atratus TaxID=8868 RepID=UPI0015D5E3F5|nr:uncharacterized protein LOC118247810 isoform X1 [Cygnus atratus]